MKRKLSNWIKESLILKMSNNMKKYRIEWDETSSQTYSLDIEAENELDAREKWEELSDAELDLTKICKSTLTMDKEYDIVKIKRVL